MATYKYVAKDLTSKTVRGKADVNNRTELVSFLRSQDLYLISCKEVVKEENTKRLSLSELSSYSREIGTMMESGISLIRTLSIMAQQNDLKPRTKAIYKDIYVKLQQGMTLSTAMQSQGKAFPDLMINMYRAGETSGQMGKTAMIMAKQYEKDQKLQNTIKTAMMYPMILIVVSIIVILIIFTVVMPQFFETFDSMNIALPGITLFMMAFSKSLQVYWYVYVLTVLISIAVISALLRVDKVRYQVDRAKLKMNKKIGYMLSIIYTAKFARTLCSLYSSGMTIINALIIVRKTVNNAYLESQFDKVIRDVRNGTTLSQAINQIDGFAPKLANSIYIGEESGKLDNMLEAVADEFDYQAEQSTKKMIALMEPMLIVVLGIAIGAVLISVLLPIFTMYQGAGSM